MNGTSYKVGQKRYAIEVFLGQNDKPVARITGTDITYIDDGERGPLKRLCLMIRGNRPLEPVERTVTYPRFVIDERVFPRRGFRELYTGPIPYYETLSEFLGFAPSLNPEWIRYHNESMLWMLMRAAALTLARIAIKEVRRHPIIEAFSSLEYDPRRAAHCSDEIFAGTAHVLNTLLQIAPQAVNTIKMGFCPKDGKFTNFITLSRRGDGWSVEATGKLAEHYHGLIENSNNPPLMAALVVGVHPWEGRSDVLEQLARNFGLEVPPDKIPQIAGGCYGSYIT